MIKKICFMVLIFLLGVSASASAAVYYVSNNGNDMNSGTAPEEAWRTVEKVNNSILSPGDKVLFECGGIWNGMLWPKGSGTSGNIIEISSYGSGEKPIINACGRTAAILLYNQQYIKVSNLEVTNKAEQAAWRYGVYVYGYECGPLYNVTLENITVHDVTGVNSSAAGNSHWNGGIVVKAVENIDKGSEATSFRNITVSGCEVYSVDRTGIAMVSNYGTLYDMNNAGMFANMKVSNNVVHDIAGDGIIIAGDRSGVVEYNTVYDTNMRQGGVNVGIFALHCIGTKIRYNESYRCRTTNDGMGYDIDGDNRNIVMEYNYSHDNEGGFMLFVDYNNRDCVARYNISQNDSTAILTVAAQSSWGNSVRGITGSFYNNTIYYEGDEIYLTRLASGVKPENLLIANNIFYLNAKKVLVKNGTLATYENNLYYFPSKQYSLWNDVSLIQDANGIYVDPMLISPGSGGNGRDTLSGYKLAEGSPCIGAGRIIENNGGLDFWGNTVSSSVAPNIGAFN